MTQLSYLLQDIDEDEQRDALDYYESYFDEAGPEHETDIINELGSPERVASIIRASLCGNPDETGEFTDRGYENARFKTPGCELAKQAHKCTDSGPRTSEGSRPRTSRLLKILLWIVLLIAAAPLLLGIGGSVAGVLTAIAGICFFLLIGLGLFTAGAFIAAIILLPTGIAWIFIHPLQGCFTSGAGMAALGTGFLLLALCLLFYGKLIPRLLCGMIEWISGMLHKGRSQK